MGEVWWTSFWILKFSGPAQPPQPSGRSARLGGRGKNIIESKAHLLTAVMMFVTLPSMLNCLSIEGNWSQLSGVIMCSGFL